MTIQNDQEFKQRLSELSMADQRIVAARFVESVAHLNTDSLITQALNIAKNKNSSDNELATIYTNIKSLAVKSYTTCGDDVDWPAQAAHFVATASKACLTPEDQMGNKKDLAWKCAMQARMAKNCEMIESESNNIDNEAQKQYDIINE